MTTEEIIKIAEKEFILPGGINNKDHGVSHWKRVQEIGRYLAKYTGANTNVTDLFAYFHDIKRENEGEDPHHGLRAAQLITKLEEEGRLNLTKIEWVHLIIACTFHCLPNKDDNRQDVTVKTCWDADRLDLWRVGVMPDPFFLNTEKAKERETIEFAKRLYENQ